MALNRFGNMVNNANDKWRNKITDSLVNDVKDLRGEQAYNQMAAEKKKADNQALWDKYKKAGQKIDVPGFDAQVVDLPKEDVNEKEIVVDRTPKGKPFSIQGPTNEQLYDLEALAGNGLPVEEDISPDDNTVVGETPIENTLGDTNNDNTTVEETPIEEVQDDTFDESQVVEPEGWDAPDIPTDTEINQPIEEVDKTEEEKPKGTSFYMPKNTDEEYELEDMAGNGQREEPPKQEEKKEEEKPAGENKDEKKPDDKKPDEKKPAAKKEGEKEPKDEEKKIEKDAADVKDNTDLVKKGSGVSVDDIVNRAGIPHYNYLSFFN